MRKSHIALTAVTTFGLLWLGRELLTRNPLWYYKFAPVPASIPEQMVQEARAKGWL